MYLIFIILLIAFCTYNFYCLFSNKFEIKDNAVLLMSIVSSVLVVSLIALILCIIGIYGCPLMLVLDALFSAIFFAVNFKKKRNIKFFDIIGKIKQIRFKKIALTVFVLAGVLFIAFPTNYLSAGRDPGLYYINGVHISKTGGIAYETDEYLNDSYSELKGIVEPGYPGLYSDYTFYENSDAQPGDITAQFMPALPALLAVGYDIGGFELLIRINGILALLVIMVIYYFVKRHFSYYAAVLAAALLALCPAFLWGARITESEILAMLVFFFGIYIYSLGQKRNSNKLALISGLFLGACVMVRMDSFIFGVGIYFMLAYYAIFNKKYVKQSLYVSLGYTVTALVGFVYGMTFSRPYFISHMEKGVLLYLLAANALMLVVSLAIAFFTRKRETGKDGFLNAVTSKKGIIMLAVLLLAAFLVLYFVRPLFANEGDIDSMFKNRSMVEFCWYTSVIGVIAAIFGFVCLLKENNRKKIYALMLYIAISIINIAIYIYKPSITADHIWAARRWVGVCIPFVIIFASYGCTQTVKIFKNKKAGKCVGAVAAAALCIFMIYGSSPFMFKSMLKDLNVQYDAVAQQMNDEVYFTDNEEIAAVFKYVYDKNVYMLKKDNTDELKKYIEKKGSILYIGDCEKTWIAQDIFDFDVEKISDNTVCGEFLERGWGEYPRETYERFYSADIYEIKLSGSDTKTYNKPGENFEVLGGSVTDDGSILSSVVDGIVMYGPYVNLDGGRYKVVVSIKAEEENSEISGKFRVSAGDNVFAEKEFDGEGKVELEFNLSEHTSGIEFVVEAVNSQSFLCDSVEVAKIAD